MPKYELRVSLVLIRIGDDLDDVAASSERSYNVDDASPDPISNAVSHAGHSFAQFVDGIQNFGLQNDA